MNILQDGDTVKALESNWVNFDNAVNDFYNDQPGIVSSVVSGTITAALLDGVDLFIVPVLTTRLPLRKSQHSEIFLQEVGPFSLFVLVHTFYSETIITI